MHGNLSKQAWETALHHLTIDFYNVLNISTFQPTRINRVSKKHKHILSNILLLLVIGAAAALPETALAAPWDSTATQILGIFTGGLTRTLAIIAVIASGIAAIAGKLSWDWAIKIVVGIVLIFGSAAIVDYVIAGASA